MIEPNQNALRPHVNLKSQIAHRWSLSEQIFRISVTQQFSGTPRAALNCFESMRFAVCPHHIIEFYPTAGRRVEIHAELNGHPRFGTRLVNGALFIWCQMQTGVPISAIRGLDCCSMFSLSFDHFRLSSCRRQSHTTRAASPPLSGSCLVACGLDSGPRRSPK